MTKNTALADAARRVRALNDRLPENFQIDVADEWSELLDAIEGRSDSQARRLIAEWIETMEQRLCSSLVNAPLDWGNG